MRDHSELAVNAVRTIHDLWQVDSDCVEWVGNAAADAIFKTGYGFDWWPGDFKVAVRVSGPHPEIDQPVYRISVRTDFLRDVDVTKPEFARRLSGSNRFAPVFAHGSHPPSISQLLDRHGISKSKLEPELSKIWLVSTAYLNESSKEWLPRWFGGVTVLQPIESQFRTEGAIPWLGGKVDHSSTTRKVRTGLNDILGAEEEEDIARYGQHQSEWIGTGEFEEIIGEWGDTETTLGRADASQLFIETPFGNDTAAVHLAAGSPHSRLGNGLLAVLTIPIFSDLESAEVLSIELNYVESIAWSKLGFPLIGSWSADKVKELHGAEYFAPTFGCFIPNMAYKRGIADQLVLWLFLRARWVRQMRMPHLVDDSLNAIMSRRLNIQRPH